MSLLVELLCRCDACGKETYGRFPMPDGHFGQSEPNWEPVSGHSITGWRLPHGKESPGPAVLCPAHAEAKP